jgi:hypothetical protein
VYERRVTLERHSQNLKRKQKYRRVSNSFYGYEVA